MGTRRWVSPGKTYFEIKTLNVCHRFSWPQRLFCGSYCRKVHAILCTWSIWALRGLFLKLFFIDTLFPPVFFIAAHMLCPLCTSKQELLLQFLTVWSIFMLLVPCSDLFLILTNIHFQAHLLKHSCIPQMIEWDMGAIEALDPYISPRNSTANQRGQLSPRMQIHRVKEFQCWKGTLRPGLILCMPQSKWNLTSNEITKRLTAHHYDSLRQSTC